LENVFIVQAQFTYFHCGDQLRKTLAVEIGEVETIVANIKWAKAFNYSHNNAVCEHQTAYNKALDAEFTRLGWEIRPVLRIDPKLIGDFRKGLVFVEIQFGNSSTLYRDYYKFQYGLANGLLSLAVLIVPMAPKVFFPTRPHSVHNMAEYALARTCLTVLPINVPTLLVGLSPED
jgi:hypothetical protein